MATYIAGLSGWNQPCGPQPVTVTKVLSIVGRLTTMPFLLGCLPISFRAWCERRMDGRSWVETASRFVHQRRGCQWALKTNNVLAYRPDIVEMYCPGPSRLRQGKYVPKNIHSHHTWVFDCITNPAVSHAYSIIRKKKVHSQLSLISSNILTTWSGLSWSCAATFGKKSTCASTVSALAIVVSSYNSP